MSPEAEGNNERKGKVNKVVRAVLITTDGYACIGKRAPGYEEGKWCLVGGVAEGENLTEELLREVGEETETPQNELSDNQEPIFTTCVTRKRHGETWENNYFIFEIDDLAIPSIQANFNKDEFSEIQFVRLEDIGNLTFAFGDKKILTEFFEKVGN